MKSMIMKSSVWLLIFSSFFFLFLSQSANAFNRPGAVSITLAGGYESFSSKRPVDNAGIPYAVVGYDFTDRWGVEALLGIFSTHAKHAADKRKYRGVLVAADGIYRFVPYRFIAPYLAAGFGVTGLNPNGNDANNEANLNVGAGALLFASQSVALRLEARDFYTMLGGKNDVMLGAGVTFLVDT